MLGIQIDLWISAGLLIFSVAVTLVTNWLAAGLRRPIWSRRISPHDVVTFLASLVWILLIYAAGVIATRYIERIDYPALGYLAYAAGAFVLSWIRALLYRRILDQPKRVTPIRAARSGIWIHYAAYLLFAIVLFLALSWLLQRSADPVLLIPLSVGALLPNLDSQTSVPGRLLPFVSRRVEERFGYMEEWRTLAANALVALITTPLILLIDVEAWYPISLGFLSHLMLDLLTPQGIMLFWPISRRRYKVLDGPVDQPGCLFERRLAASLAVVAAILFLVVDVGRPAPPAAPAPSYEETFRRYYAMRGNNQVFAYVEGTWQATGKRMSGWLEILNAVGESFILLDRFDGTVFTGGRGAEDNLYLNRISLRTGPSIRVKPTEIRLEDQSLASGLAVLYEMQREPGLEHIYVSGDVFLPLHPDGASPLLPADYTQTRLRRIQGHHGGHYTLHYLTASDLIALANVRVELADLVIVATYTSPVGGPTVTPLPPPPPTLEPGP
jgi:inner membrane protein